MTKNEFENHHWRAKDTIILNDDKAETEHMVTAVDFEQGLIEYSSEGGYRNEFYSNCTLTTN